jgi:hypothetical protein
MPIIVSGKLCRVFQCRIVRILFWSVLNITGTRCYHFSLPQEEHAPQEPAIAVVPSPPQRLQPDLDEVTPYEEYEQMLSRFINFYTRMNNR